MAQSKLFRQELWDLVYDVDSFWWVGSQPVEGTNSEKCCISFCADGELMELHARHAPVLTVDGSLPLIKKTTGPMVPLVRDAFQAEGKPEVLPREKPKSPKRNSRRMVN